MNARRRHNDRVLARMHVAAHLDGDDAALAKLRDLPYDAWLEACIEALDDEEDDPCPRR